MLTKSQGKVIQDHLNQRLKVRVTQHPQGRARLFITCENGFSYVLYVGKRGKIYETESGDL